MKTPEWIKAGQTVTADRLKEAKDFPQAARAELWKGRTLNKAAAKLIMEAVNKEPAPKKKEGDK